MAGDWFAAMGRVREIFPDEDDRKGKGGFVPYRKGLGKASRIEKYEGASNICPVCFTARAMQTGECSC